MNHTMRFYELGGDDGHTPVLIGTMDDLHKRMIKTPDDPELTKLFMHVGRVTCTPLKSTKLSRKRRLSSIFLGHALGPQDPPWLFETMMFGFNNALLQRRYATYDQAMADHDVIAADPDKAVADEHRQTAEFVRAIKGLTDRDVG